eukprot:1141064-Pelagomonas_calceolata.AAC.2
MNKELKNMRWSLGLNATLKEHQALGAPNPKITYLPNLQNALKSHMHAKHRLGYANPKTGYYSYYQSLLLLLILTRKSAMPLETCPIYPQL